MNIFGNLFRGKELENKKAEFEELKDKYIKEGESISEDPKNYMKAERIL